MPGVLDGSRFLLDRGVAFLLDLDGTLYKGEAALPRAVDLITALRRHERKFMLCTNNSSRTPKQTLWRLRQLGFEVDGGELLTSLQVLIHHWNTNLRGDTAYVVGTDSVRAYLQDQGVEQNAKADVVILTFDTEMTYAKLQVAHELLVRGADYVATHGDTVCPTLAGHIPDCGSFISLLEASTGRRPLILGKPNRPMLNAALRVLNVKAEQLIVIGDRLYTDVRMANECGARSILVLTGDTRRQDLESCQ